MNFFNVKSSIRKLANSDYYQTLYAYFKDGMPVKIFINDLDFTDLQIMFLKYLGFYSTISMDIALGDVSGKVLEDEIYSDAYMMYKNKSTMKQIEDNKTNQNKDVEQQPTTRWLFKNSSGMQEKIKTQVKDLERAVKPNGRN